MIISNKKMGYITKIVKYFEELDLLMLKALLKQLKIKQNNKKVDFLASY